MTRDDTLGMLPTVKVPSCAPTGCHKWGLYNSWSKTLSFLYFQKPSSIGGGNLFVASLTICVFKIMFTICTYMPFCWTEVEADWFSSRSLPLECNVSQQVFHNLGRESCWQAEGQSATERRNAALGGESLSVVDTYHQSPQLHIVLFCCTILHFSFHRGQIWKHTLLPKLHYSSAHSLLLAGDELSFKENTLSIKFKQMKP